MVIDARGGMQEKKAELVAAALAFVKFSNPPKQPRAALYGRRPQGRTALYDAPLLAGRHLTKGKRESKALLLISDGGDNNSMHTLREAVHAVELSGAAVYGVALYDPEQPEHNLGTLHRLSQLTGGETFGPAEFYRISARVSASPQTFAPAIRSRTRRRMRIDTRDTPAAAKLRVRARTTYILERQSP